MIGKIALPLFLTACLVAVPAYADQNVCSKSDQLISGEGAAHFALSSPYVRPLVQLWFREHKSLMRGVPDKVTVQSNGSGPALFIFEKQGCSLATFKADPRLVWKYLSRILGRVV